MVTIRLAESGQDIRDCFAVMQQLRPHLSADTFVPRIRRQMEGGYSLALLQVDGEPRAVAGYRFIDNLASGRVLYVDDLVTDSRARSRGFGGRLFDWLVERAKDAGCQTLELDSGVQRHEAHRFYMARRMSISSHDFRLTLAISQHSSSRSRPVE